MIKRILHIIPSTALGGTSSFIMNIYRNIDKEKIQFDFVVFNKGELHEEIIDMGGRIFYFEWIKNQGVISYIKSLRKLIKNEGPFHAVHAHQSYKASLSLIPAKLEQINIRIAHTHAVNPETKWHNILIPFLKRITLRSSTKLIACSQVAGENIYGKDNFIVIPNNINIEKFLNTSIEDRKDIRRKLNISEDMLLIGHVGRFSEVKNQKFIIDIAEELKNKNKEFKCLLVGEGPLKKEIKDKINVKNLNGNFLILPPQKEINKIMKSLDVFICPSLFESFSMVLLEAQVLGIPCIASSNVPIDVDLNLGLLKYKDINGTQKKWAEEILSFKLDQDIQKQEIKDKVIEKGFDLESITKKIIEIYNI